MLTVESQEIQDFLSAWHENNRISYRGYKNLDYDRDNQKTAHDRRKYIACDYGNKTSRSGAFLIDKKTHIIYSIKGYGQRGYCLGMVEELTVEFHKATATQKPERDSYWQQSHKKIMGMGKTTA